MRSLSPEKRRGEPETAGPEPGRKSIFNLTVPFKIWRGRYFISFLIGKDLGEADQEDFLSPGERAMETVIVFAVLLIMLMVVAGGLVFLVYLIKSFLGIDVFPFSHVFR